MNGTYGISHNVMSREQAARGYYGDGSKKYENELHNYKITSDKSKFDPNKSFEYVLNHLSKPMGEGNKDVYNTLSNACNDFTFAILNAGIPSNKQVPKSAYTTYPVNSLKHRGLIEGNDFEDYRENLPNELGIVTQGWDATVSR